MATRSLRFCNHPGCGELVATTYCDEHARLHQRENDTRRGSAHARGYGYKWQQYSKAFLRRPENQICKLHLPGCTTLAQCVDHIQPPSGASDPLFWNKENHQAACIRCNSVKGRRTIKGDYDLGV